MFSSMNQASLQFRFSTEKGGEYLPTVCHRRNQWIVGGGGGGGRGRRRGSNFPIFNFTGFDPFILKLLNFNIFI